MSKVIRHGDVNLHVVKEARGKILQHNGSWILAKGEATGSIHTLSVNDPKDLIIQQDGNGDMYFTLKSEGVITHTNNHETIPAPPEIYRQVPERELDHFADNVERKTVD